jgi:hypothetical protein
MREYVRRCVHSSLQTSVCMQREMKHWPQEQDISYAPCITSAVASGCIDVDTSRARGAMVLGLGAGAMPQAQSAQSGASGAMPVL